MNVQVKTESSLEPADTGEIKFNIDPAMLQRLQNAPGFVPVIINIQPTNNLREFLGVYDGVLLT